MLTIMFTLICFLGAAKNFFQYHVLSENYESEILACDFWITVLALSILFLIILGLTIAFVNRLKKEIVG